MNGLDKVEKFIRDYNVYGELLKLDRYARTSEDASQATGIPKDHILKTIIVIGSNNTPYAILLPGDKKINYDRLKKILKVRDVRLASFEDVKNITGLEPGEVSPFTEEVKRLTCILDLSAARRDVVVVGGGSHYTLIKTRVSEIIRVLKPIVAEISK
jgi:prolyl-tRNA editing enzyme YbaK/EbsC (Cys-tRNA(Pro) deacylase)